MTSTNQNRPSRQVESFIRLEVADTGHEVGRKGRVDTLTLLWTGGEVNSLSRDNLEFAKYYTDKAISKHTASGASKTSSTMRNAELCGLDLRDQERKLGDMGGKVNDRTRKLAYTDFAKSQASSVFGEASSAQSNALLDLLRKKGPMSETDFGSNAKYVKDISVKRSPAESRYLTDCRLFLHKDAGEAIALRADLHHTLLRMDPSRKYDSRFDEMSESEDLDENNRP